MRHLLSTALRLALRELRSGLQGFRIFLACLILGVSAIAVVRSNVAVNRPRLTVGRPRPITPFAVPAIRKVMAIAEIASRSNIPPVYLRVVWFAGKDVDCRA